MEVVREEEGESRGREEEGEGREGEGTGGGGGERRWSAMYCMRQIKAGVAYFP